MPPGRSRSVFGRVRVCLDLCLCLPHAAKAFRQQAQDEAHGAFYTVYGAVYAQIVAGDVAPTAAGVKSVIFSGFFEFISMGDTLLFGDLTLKFLSFSK